MKLSLKSRISLNFVLLSAVLLATVDVLSYRSGSKSLEADAMSERLSKAVETEAGLDAWIAERMSDIGEISGHADVVDKTVRLIAAPPASPEARSMFRRSPRRTSRTRTLRECSWFQFHGAVCHGAG